MSAVLMILAACAVLGFTIQKGSICVVAAVNELWATKRYEQGRSLLETVLWITLLVNMATLVGLHIPATPRIVPGFTVALGGVFLGIGAWLNGGCALGTLAKIGSGQWTYSVTLGGIVAGTEAAAKFGMVSQPSIHTQVMPNVIALIALSGVLLVVLHWRSSLSLTGSEDRNSRHGVKRATVAIGICATVIALTVGSWSYTDALRSIFRDCPLTHVFDLAMVVTILGGAIVGGRIGNTIVRPKASGGLLEYARHLGGGLLMGLGGGLVPGGNDQLILFDAPMFESFAWLALATMALTILACLIVSTRTAVASSKSMNARR